MKIRKTKQIQVSKEEIWRIVAEDFDQIAVWFKPVYHSTKIQGEEAKSCDLSQPEGRMCDLSGNENGLKMEERITRYDREQCVLEFDAVPRNVPFGFPVMKSEIRIRVTADSKTASTVELDVDVHLKWSGLLLYPLILVGFSKTFGDMLRQLKLFAEKEFTQLADVG